MCSVMKEGKFLYCYKMTHDSGFAPNPDHGVLTLATCKPTIRRCAEKGCWISGWTANKVKGKKDIFTFADVNQKLIYLAKVTDKISIAEYWDKYPQKRPSLTNWVNDFGDNIYEPIGDGGNYIQHNNGGGHNDKNRNHDLSGKFVLICEEFYYYGVENALRINIEETFVVPRCKKLPLEDKIAQSIIQRVKNNHDQCKYCKCL